MKFSEYVITERAGILVDPLGFLKPSRALQDTIFRQFTVLTNRPGYHGFLCMAWQLLDGEGYKAGSAGFSRKFRETEIFWGLLNAAQGTPILNITKYRDLLDERIGLKKISGRDAIYSRLAYGTLGHYSQPSLAWGLLEPGARALNAHGAALAKAAASRDKHDFTKWLARWNAGEEFVKADLMELKQAFHLQALPSTGEQTQWQQLIARWTSLHAHTKPLWDQPMSFEELDTAALSPRAHHEFHQTLKARYPALAAEMAAIERFERLSGAVQFIFDTRLAMLEVASTAPLEPMVERDELAVAIVAIAKENSTLQGHQPGKLFSELAATPAKYEKLEDVIISHHIRHQRAKGVSPFLDGSRLLVTGKADRNEIGRVLEDVASCATVGDKINQLQYRSRRDWHFRRCRTWHDWAYGAVQ